MSNEKHTTGPDPQSTGSLEKAAIQDSQMQEVHAQLMRDKDVPAEGFSPVPILLLFVFSTLCFLGGVYLVQYSGGFRWDAYSPDFDPHADAPAPAVIPLFVRGKKIFTKQCIACHQASGLGVPGVYPPLAGSEWVTGHQETLARILINGLNGPMVVAGKNYNGNMPAFGPNGLNLKSKDIAAVLTYIRQDWGNSASDITEDTLETYMAQYSARATPWNAVEVIEGLSAEPVLVPVIVPGNDEAEAEPSGAEAGEAEPSGAGAGEAAASDAAEVAATAQH